MTEKHSTHIGFKNLVAFNKIQAHSHPAKRCQCNVLKLNWHKTWDISGVCTDPKDWRWSRIVEKHPGAHPYTQRLKIRKKKRWLNKIKNKKELRWAWGKKWVFVQWYQWALYIKNTSERLRKCGLPLNLRCLNWKNILLFSRKVVLNLGESSKKHEVHLPAFSRAFNHISVLITGWCLLIWCSIYILLILRKLSWYRPWNLVESQKRPCQKTLSYVFMYLFFCLYVNMLIFLTHWKQFKDNIFNISSTS